MVNMHLRRNLFIYLSSKQLNNMKMKNGFNISATSKESHPSQYHKCDVKKYDRNELIKMMRMRALGESDFYDDVYTSDRAQFIDSVSKFIEWIDKMQTKNKI